MTFLNNLFVGGKSGLPHVYSYSLVASATHIDCLSVNLCRLYIILGFLHSTQVTIARAFWVVQRWGSGVGIGTSSVRCWSLGSAPGVSTVPLSGVCLASTLGSSLASSSWASLASTSGASLASTSGASLASTSGASLASTSGACLSSAELENDITCVRDFKYLYQTEKLLTSY